MSVDWRFAPDGTTDRGGPSRPEPDPGPPSGSRRALAAAALAVGAVAAVLALRALANARVLDGAERDVRVVVAAEEAALARGDAEVARLHQTEALRRRARDPRLRGAILGLSPPLPGLAVAGAGEVERVDVRVGPGGRIEQADVALSYLVTDGEITGTFQARRAMRLGPDGRWRHDVPADDGPSPPAAVFVAGALEARAPEDERAWLAPALERAAARRDRLCRMVDCAVAAADRLRIDLVEGSGVTRWRSGRGELVLELPAPAGALRPADEAARALLGRAVERAVLAHGVLGAALETRPGTSRSVDSRTTALAAGLAEAMLQRDPVSLGGAESGSGPAVAADPAYPTLLELWPPGGADAAATAADGSEPADIVRRGGRSFGSYVARELGAGRLARLVAGLRGALQPDASWGGGGAATPYGWLESSLGPAYADAVLSWPDPQAPAPSDVGFVAECLRPDAFGRWRGVPMRVRPGERPVAIGQGLCGPGRALAAPPGAAAGRIAGLCVTPQGNERTSAPARLFLSVLEPDGTVRELALDGAPPDILSGPSWSADAANVGFVLARGDDPREGYPFEPWLVDAPVDPAGALAARRVDRQVLDTPLWPTSARYAALAWRPGEGQTLARVVPTADGPRVVVQDAAADAPTWSAGGFAPTWSADGRRLAILAETAGSRLQLAVHDASTGAALASRTVDLSSTGRRSGASRAAPEVDARTLAWSPDGAWLAAHVVAQTSGLLALLAWNPDTGVLHVAEYERLELHGGDWRTVWHPDEPVAFLLRGDVFPERGDAAPWQTAPPSPFALDARTGRAEHVEPGDPALEPLRWPRSPDGRLRLRRDAVGRLIVEPVGGGEGWRLNATGCAIDVAWLGASGR